MIGSLNRSKIFKNQSIILILTKITNILIRYPRSLYIRRHLKNARNARRSIHITEALYRLSESSMRSSPNIYRPRRSPNSTRKIGSRLLTSFQSQKNLRLMEFR